MITEKGQNHILGFALHMYMCSTTSISYISSSSSISS